MGFICDNKYMKIKEISKQELLDIIFDRELIGAGNYGKVYKLDDNTLFKFYYEKLSLDRTRTDIEALYRNIENLKHELYRIKDTTIYKIMQRKVKGGSIPKGLLFTEGALVGSVLNRENGYSLQTVMKGVDDFDTATKRTIEENLYCAYEELIANFIYPYDVKSDNVIIDPKTLASKVIDLDDECTAYQEALSPAERGEQKDVIMGRVEKMFAYEIEKNSSFKFKRKK